MEKQLISAYGRLHDIKNDIIDRLKSDEKKHGHTFINCIYRHKRKSCLVTK
jgi:hypothetical protein